MADKDDNVRKTTVTSEEVQNGQQSRYVKAESQQVLLGQTVEVEHTTTHLSQVSVQQQQLSGQYDLMSQAAALAQVTSDVAPHPSTDSQISASGSGALGPSPAQESVGTVSMAQTTDVTSTVKMRTHTRSAVETQQRLGDRLTHPSDDYDMEHDRKRDSTHILEKFEEQAKSFQEQMLLLPSKPKKPRTPSPGIFRQSVGLDHLDNLVRLMEQLTQLRDENCRLKKRCEYLENTKSLLQVRTLMGGQEIPMEGPPPAPAGYLTLPTTSRPKQRRLSEDLGVESRPRLASAEDSQYLDTETTEENLTSGEMEPRKRLHKRSYSTGSIDVPDGVMSEEQVSEANGSKHREPLADIGKSSLKHKKKSKWAKVKKVFSGHKSTEETGAAGGQEPEGGITLTVPDLTGQDAVEKHLLATPHVGLSESRSVDSGVGSGLEGADTLRMSTSSGEPSSPSRKMVHSRSGSSQQDTPGESGAESWVGPPGWEECQTQRQGSFASGLSDEGSSAEGKSSKAHSAKEGKEKAQYLKVDSRYPYVRRSSSLEGLEELQKNNKDEARQTRLHRSASTKSDGKSPSPDGDGSSSSKEKKLHKSAWGRVKDIIHTRKDSLKKRTKKVDKSDSEISEGIEYSDFLADLGEISEGKVSPKSSTKSRNGQEAGRQSVDAGAKKSSRLKSSGSGSSPPGVGSLLPPQHSVMSLDVSQLMGAMTDEYVKKMQEWEEMKSKKPAGSRGSLSPAKSKEQRSKEGTPEGAVTPVEPPWHSINVDEIQRSLTESFHRKLQEWEKMKYRRDHSPMMERKSTSSAKKKEERKPKKSKSEKEKEKQDRLREREIHRVEKEVQKLEREKIRLEKERLRALEKEAKIEKMKGRLSQADIETKIKNPILGPLSEYKVTTEFARKLHEWEVRKGMSQEASTSLYLEIQKRSLELADEMYHGEAPKHSRPGRERRVGSTDTLSPPVSPLPKDTPVFTLEGSPSDEPVEGELERQLSEESSLPPPEAEGSSSVTEEGLTSVNIVSLEKANVSLMEELRKKENEYMTAQLEVHNLNMKLQTMKDSHTRTLVTYRQEMETLQQGEQPLPQVSLTDLEGKIQELETFGDRVVLSMESAASIEGEEAVGDQLMELVDQMKSMLSKVSHTEEASKRSSMMHDFEKLYSHAMQLQVQMNNLRLSHLERNKEIMDLKRQLLLQEVTNLLLQVDITRRETELTHYKESKQRSLNRSSTYSDLDPDEKVDTDDSSPKPSEHHFSSLKESLQYETKEVEGERSPKSPAEGDTSREHTLDVFFPYEGRARSSTTSADSTELSSAKSGDTGSMSDDPFVASLPASESVEMLPPDQCGTPADGQDSDSLPVLKLQPVPAAKSKHEKQDSLKVLPEHTESAVFFTADPESDTKTERDSGVMLPDQLDTGMIVHEEDLTGVISHDPGVTSVRLPEETITAVGLPERSDTDVTSPVTDITFEQSVTGDSWVSRDQTSPEQSDNQVHVPVKAGISIVQEAVTSAVRSPSVESKQILHRPSETVQCPSTSSQAVQPLASVAQSTTSGVGPQENPDRPKTVVLTKPAKLRQDSTSRLFAQSARLKMDSSSAAQDTHSPVAVSHHVIYSSSQLHSNLPRGEKLSEWLKREPKLPKLVIPDYKKVAKGSEKPRLEKTSAVEEDSNDVLYLPDSGGRTEEPVTGLPPSPVIRSRQTRRLRAEEKLSQQKHTTSDLARLPATPPRNSRHRMAKQEQTLEEQQNGRRSLYVTSDPNLQIPLASMELLKQSEELEASCRSAPDGFPRTSPSHPDLSPDGGRSTEGHKPISDMISKFEKQSTAESAHGIIGLRKSPSPTIVSHVSPIRKLKPASELLQESQKSKGRALSPRGHVHRLEAMTQRTQSEENTSSTRSQNKENVSEVSYVQTMVHRLSRETTPERRHGSKDSSPRSGSSSVIRSDSPRSNCEFVQHIVRKLSTTTEPDHNRSLSPLKDLTNDGQVKSLTEAFSAGSSRSSPERMGVPTSPSRSRARLVQKTRSASSSRSPPVSRAVHPRLTSPSQPGTDMVSVYDKHGMGSTSPTSPRSQPPTRGRFVGLSQPIPYKPDSAISVTCSLPSSVLTTHPYPSLAGHPYPYPHTGSSVASVIPEERISAIMEDLSSVDSSPIPSLDRTRVTEQTREMEGTRVKFEEKSISDIEVLEKNIVTPVTPEPETPGRSKSPTSPRFKRSLFSKGGQGGKKSSAQKLPPLPKSAEKPAQSGGKGLRGTIGTLCQQAMSFDLGISLHLSKDQDHDRVDFRKSDPVKLPSDCPQGMPPKSPSTHSDEGGLSPQSTDDKGKSKGKFLDYSWLQKSKKLFKVSNPPPTSQPEDSSCQACHGRPGDSNVFTVL
ncbi:uncharacterized protein LOC135473334 isoform X2 [Liolophura sinensis]|uniref:uncharacterized protein LOC135473334 isoform X2 n=1 Tax=Liolophura sinensis TaxID=3198878 RepID=UPI003159541C